MKALFLFVTLLLTACNGSPNLPELNGKFQNHTPFPTESFKINAMLSCYTRDLLGWRQSCGTAGTSVHPDANGKFTLPALSVSSGGSEYEFSFSLVPPDAETSTILHSRKSVHYDFNGDNFKDIEKIKNISAFYMPEQRLIFKPSSGTDSHTWATTLGRDTFIKYSLKFDSSFPSLYDWSNDQLNGDSVESIDTIPARILFTNTLLPENAPIKIHGELTTRYLAPNCDRSECVIAQLDETVPFSSILDESARTFTFDDSKLHAPIKTIEGIWKTTIHINEGIAPEYETNFFDGNLNVNCVNGNIIGSIHLESRGANKQKFNGDIPVRGFCRDEEGEIEFDFQYATYAAVQKITMPYQRIFANSSDLMATDVDTFEKLQGRFYTRYLAARNALGKKIGKATFSKR